MKLLILGGGGMLGHKLWLTARDRFQASVTLRGSGSEYRRFGIFEHPGVIFGVDAFDMDSVVRAFDRSKPDAVVNCVGVIKQLPTAKDPITSLTINALFPHRLAALCRATGARLVHVSTDCVFAGTRGNYTESDETDATDLYGRSKGLGEVGAPALTLRTSMIGRELSTSTSLIEWFLSNRGGSVDGYTGAQFTGLTTAALSRIVLEIIERRPDLSGLYHLAADPINKFDLLTLVRDTMSLPIEIRRRDDVAVNRTLDGSRLKAAGISVPDWPSMIRELAEDPTPYDEWRQTRVA